MWQAAADSLPGVAAGPGDRLAIPGGMVVKTHHVIALTVLVTVATFSAGGLVATVLIRSMMPAMTPVATAVPVEVTRATGQIAPLPAEAPQAAAVQGQGLGLISAAVAAPSQADVAAAVPAPVDPAPVRTAEVQTTEVLRDLAAQAQAPTAEEDLVLLDLVSAEQSRDQFENAIPERLTESVLTAVASGRTEEDLIGMVSYAIDLGLVEAPEALRTPEGAPDARAILFSILQDAQTATGEVIVLAGGTEVRPVERPSRNETYTVQPGDSLAYIALMFYGDAEQYRVIFNANRSRIDSPDRIDIGQRLIIPAI